MALVIFVLIKGSKFAHRINIFHRFDVLQKKWEKLPDMLRQRDYFSVVCLRGRIYALGGSWTHSQCLDEVESYCPEENSWRYYSEKVNCMFIILTQILICVLWFNISLTTCCLVYPSSSQ